MTTFIDTLEEKNKNLVKLKFTTNINEERKDLNVFCLNFADIFQSAKDYLLQQQEAFLLCFLLLLMATMYS